MSVGEHNVKRKASKGRVYGRDKHPKISIAFDEETFLKISTLAEATNRSLAYVVRSLVVKNLP